MYYNDGNSFQLHGTSILPVGLFEALKVYAACVINVYTTARHYATYKYVSDTQVQVVVSNSSYQIAIYGIK